MNYKKIYYQLIERAKLRKIDGYTEQHHILPRCLGGTNNKDNIVSLTAREHFIAHLLLVKVYNGNLKLVKAVSIMCIGQQERKLTNRLYGRYRELLSIAQSECQTGVGNSQFGTRWIHNPLTKEEKKIKGEIPLGWLYGRNKTSQKKIVSKKAEKIKCQKETYKKYYEIYKNVGFTKFVQLTGYDKSKANLVQRFSYLVEDFVPQNGKKRGFIPE